jgi:hypothetical protein
LSSLPLSTFGSTMTGMAYCLSSRSASHLNLPQDHYPKDLESCSSVGANG